MTHVLRHGWTLCGIAWLKAAPQDRWISYQDSNFWPHVTCPMCKRLANESFACPKCGRVSWSPNDKREGYCGACHEWTAEAKP